MKKPIFRIFLSYEIKKKKAITRRAITGTIDTFTTTSDIDSIKKDKELINRICYIHKKIPEKVDVTITDVEIEGQYGETTDRF
jgi:hypothetical protein|tara:strand:- start:206 stop:454 length:249 start_codon:yes stop_codon:yes gene_type:complete